MMKPVNYSVYVVTDDASAYKTNLLNNVEQAVQAGAGIVQYRPVSGNKQFWYKEALKLKDLLAQYNVPLIINDYVDLALAVDADGVHVGQSDLPVEVCRKLIGSGKLLGLSITDLPQLEKTPFELIDYIGVGPIFHTDTKSDAAPEMGLHGLKTACEKSPVPVVAIGGISLKNAASVFENGAVGIAIVSAISRVSSPADSVQAFLRMK
jgi:thiamine-phosphate pyrophosphorylase